MLPDPFIAPDDAAVITDPFVIGDRVVTYQIIGTLLAGEYFRFEIEDPAAGSGWRTLTIDSVAVEIVPGNDQVTFYAPSYVRVNKSITTANCGLRSITGVS